MISRPTFYNLYTKTKKRTYNFKRITSNLIKTDSQVLLILRCILKLAQRPFSKKIGISASYLWELEHNKLNPSKNKSIKISSKLKYLKFESINKNQVYLDYRRLNNQGKLNSNRAKEIRKLVKKNCERGIKSMANKPPLNIFEKEISCLLDKNNFKFKINYPIEAKTKMYVVDFCVFKKNIPIAIIEVKQTNTLVTRRIYDILKQFAIKIDHFSRNMKLKNPKIKVIAILSSKNKHLVSLSKSLQNEFIDTDKVFCDGNLNKVLFYLKRLL